MWISGFFCHSDFTWNQFWSFWSPPKIAVLTISTGLNLNFWELLTLFSANFFQKSKFKASVEMATLPFWNHLKLISRKIRVARNLLNFYAVEYPKSKLGCPGLWLYAKKASESKNNLGFSALKIDSLQFACHFLVTLHFQVCRSKNRCLNVELIVFLT